MTRVVSSGTTSNGDVVFYYDAAAWIFSGAQTFGSSNEAQAATPPPSDATPVTPPPLFFPHLSPLDKWAREGAKCSFHLLCPHGYWPSVRPQ